MNSVDFVIILAGIAVFIRGFRVGILRQVASVGGFFVGLLIGSWITPLAASSVTDGALRTLLILALTLGLATVLSNSAEIISWRLRNRIQQHHVRRLESALGAVFGVASVLIASWLIAAMLYRFPLIRTNQAIERSVVVQTLNSHLPPVPDVISRIAHLIAPNGFPRVFVDNEPRLNPTGPPADAAVRAAAAKTQGSVVLIEGAGCGGLVEGSGFVVGPGMVATNAHVLAGVRRPVVIYKGRQFVATPVVFDPNTDFAVLRVQGQLGTPLALHQGSLPRGTSGAVIGYPGGGPLTISPAIVLDRRRAIGRNIYNQRVVSRSIYEIASDVEPGNSGGALALEDGTVGGVVFAKSVGTEGFGYVLTADEVSGQLALAAQRTAAVSTGPCSSD